MNILMMKRTFNRTSNIIYGIIGILAGIVFLYLNLSDPASASTSNWVWCAIGFVAGGFLLARAFLARSN